MAIPYRHKRSTAAGVEPTTLQDGEIAINTAAADPKLFYKDSASTIRAFSLASYASSTHTHVASSITNLTSVANVVSVNGQTGVVVLTNSSVSAASATHTHVAADITNLTSVANVVSVNAKTGVVTISHTDVTAASSTHTHAASDVTSGTFDAARLPLATTIAAGAVIVGTGLGVSSGTVSVTYGTTAGTSCQGNDSRLSDTRTPTDGTVTTAKIANSAVTYAKIQNVSATDRLLGRSSAGAGVVEEITCTSFARSILDDASAADVRSTLSVQPTASPAFTGTVSAAAASFTGTVTVTSPLVLTGTVAGNVRQIKMQTSGVDRWQITPSFDAESGSDAGSNFQITRWSDAGSFLGTPLYITRSTGIVNCESGLVVVSGNVGIGTSSPTISSGVGLHISGSTLRLGTARTPASASATGNTGEICWDASYLYVCTATNTWRRIAHSTW